jgi:hypothetical protein
VCAGGGVPGNATTFFFAALPRVCGACSWERRHMKSCFFQKKLSTWSLKKNEWRHSWEGRRLFINSDLFYFIYNIIILCFYDTFFW